MKAKNQKKIQPKIFLKKKNQKQKIETNKNSKT